MLNVGITGNIGSGKTTVCQLFELLGVPIYYADERGKNISNEDPGVVADIKNLFGEEIYDTDKKLRRAEVAKIVFSDKKKLAALSAIVHPAVAVDAERWFEKQKKLGKDYSIKEAALLVENASYKKLDKLIVVSAPIETRLQRVIARDGSDRAAVEARMKNQLSESEKEKVADYIIVNDGSQALIPQVMKIHRSLISAHR